MAKASDNSGDFGSFSDLASIKGNQVEKPKNLPDANYSAMITGPFKENKAKSGNFSLRFPAKLVECLDESIAADIQADPRLQKAFGKDYHVDWWMSPDARYRFTSFCAAHGIDQELDLISMAEQLVASGAIFLVQGASQKNPDKPDDEGFFNLNNPAPLPA